MPKYTGGQAASGTRGGSSGFS